MKQLFVKYRELILYVFFGGLTTLVNWGLYWLLANPLGVPYLWATAIAQIASILFAYVTNRIWVFQSKARGFREVSLEMLRFFGARGVPGPGLHVRGGGPAPHQRHLDEAAGQYPGHHRQLCVQQGVRVPEGPGKI